MVSKVRTQRIAEQIREDLSDLLHNVVTDPCLEGVTITDVTVDRELAYAKIYVSALEGSERKDEIMDGLDRARGFLRYQLTQLIELRSFPQLRFAWDATAERAARIDDLIASLHTSESQTEDDEAPTDE